ncbi:hypothetical protein CHS0354_037294 [Potamilus streckersoni]|uniref:Protein fem-1 homolog B n=1 Tax=Potamilus streckersoni TaxID=2493646 RepID=A0AAE0TKN5_9BIVA|nr:hypothetical protein CHS0354_037294 [Potamilus streckersoni]
METDINKLKKKCFAAASDGRSTYMSSILANGVTQDVMVEVLNHRTSQNGQSITPLITAVIQGHDDIVRLLLNLPETDIERGGNVIIDKQIINNARPLWCAAAFKRLPLIKLLIESGANIDGATETNSTPLRPACFDGNIDIVKYLIDCGADVNRTNKWGHSCLMVAAFFGHISVVEYLCRNGADIDTKDQSGATALHYAAEGGRLEVIKLLSTLGSNSKDTKDSFSFTPLMRAANFAKCDIVEFFIFENVYTREENIQALELLGARLSIPDQNEVQLSLNYYKNAMDLRYNSNPIPKEYLGPIAAFENHCECKTQEDLDNIKENELLLQMEALAVCERILGPTHEKFEEHLVCTADACADKGNYRLSINLIKHIVLLNQNDNKHVDHLLKTLIEFITEMVYNYDVPEFNDVIESLQLIIREFKRNKQREDDSEMVEKNIKTCIYCIGISLKCAKDDRDIMSLRTEIKQFIRLNLKVQDDSTPLHIVVSSTNLNDYFPKAGVVTFPNASLCSEFILCGADVNSMDSRRNSPLHKAAQQHHTRVDVHTQRTIIQNLLQAGAHVDMTNSDGLTAIQCVQSCVSEAILKNWIVSLKCIVSNAIIRCGIPYRNRVSCALENFIELHV